MMDVAPDWIRLPVFVALAVALHWTWTTCVEWWIG
jgi:hypothetical protein